MMRVLFISLLTFSILHSSNRLSENVRVQVDESNSNTELSKEVGAKKNKELARATSQSKVNSAKKTRNEFKKDLDTKMKIAKKVFSSKTGKKPQQEHPSS